MSARSQAAVGDAEAAIRRVSRIYQSRMRCEETFRDSRNLRFGLGLGHISVRQPQRVGVLLHLAALALWVASVLGCLAEHAGIARSLQANTMRCRRVLSLAVLGLMVIEHRMDIPASMVRFRAALRIIHAQQQAVFAP